MLKPIHEPYNGPVSYPISATLSALANDDLRNTGATDLNLPYGEGNTVGFDAGLICKISNQSGVTVIDLPSAVSDDPIGILADGFVDSLKSGKASFYLLSIGGIFKVKSDYDTSQTYAVNTKLTFIATGSMAGYLTPASVYGTQPIVARVIEAPSNASQNTEMVIEILYQVEV
jgi:hypothetical protein